MKRNVPAGIVLLAAATVAGCVPPETRFLQARPANHVSVAPVIDTVLVRRLDGDSTSLDGVRTAWVVHDRAVESGASALASTVRSAVAGLPAGQNTLAPVADSVFGRMQRRPLHERLTLLRADVLTFTDVVVDTVLRVAPADSSGPARTPRRWVALIITGEASTDPAEGRRLGRDRQP